MKFHAWYMDAFATLASASVVVLYAFAGSMFLALVWLIPTLTWALATYLAWRDRKWI